MRLTRTIAPVSPPASRFLSRSGLRPRLWSILTVGLLVLCLAALAACSSAPTIDRVDVTWASLSPPPRWGLYPGYRQEIDFRERSAYLVEVYSGGQVVTGGTVGDTGMSLAFVPTAGARDIEARLQGTGALSLYVTLKDEKGGAQRLLCLKVERKGGKIWFEFPK